MARRQSTPLRAALSRMFPATLMRRLARETGTVQRQRRVDPVKLFWVVVLGVGERSFAELRRSYQKVTGDKISPNSFYNRFTPAFTRFLRELLNVGLEKLQRCAEGAAPMLGEISEEVPELSEAPTAARRKRRGCTVLIDAAAQE